MGRFPKLLTGLFRDFRNSYNEGVDKIDAEFDLQKKRVDDLIKGTPQPSEVVDARGGHPILRDRLNEVDAHLARTESELVELTPKNNAYMKVIGDGLAEFKSAINPSWEKWVDDTYSYGFVTDRTPIWHQFLSSIEVDGMVTAYSGKGRWNTNDSDITRSTFVNGGHVFEGWNADKTGRLTMLVGKHEDYADIQYFNNVTKDFGWVKLGSDWVDEGFDFGRKLAKFHGNVVRPDRTGFLEFNGGTATGGNRDGSAVKVYGDEHSTLAGSLEFLFGSYKKSVKSSIFFRFMKTNLTTNDVLEINQDGRALLMGELRLARLASDPTIEAGVQQGGFIYYNTTMSKFRVNINGTWKSLVTE